MVPLEFPVPVRRVADKSTADAGKISRQSARAEASYGVHSGQARAQTSSQYTLFKVYMRQEMDMRHTFYVYAVHVVYIYISISA